MAEKNKSDNYDVVEVAERTLNDALAARKDALGFNGDWTSVDPVNNWDLENSFKKFNLTDRLYEAYNTPQGKIALALACIVVFGAAALWLYENVDTPVKHIFTPLH
ncbi:MAG: hypothetical protein Q7R49_03730 [Candidatus Daviesbacteria bacterium]|nr:hypothetical protein [Candidatus Daviesbacteria bacterium]